MGRPKSAEPKESVRVSKKLLDKVRKKANEAKPPVTVGGWVDVAIENQLKNSAK